jgi:NAD(P)H-hydrate epimerase
VVQAVSLNFCSKPTDNGGDGIIASRHLKFFGYEPVIFYPKQTDKQHFRDLVKQAVACKIPFIDSLPVELNKDFDLVVDAIFGFSFKGDIREPFLSTI